MSAEDSLENEAGADSVSPASDTFFSTIETPDFGRYDLVARGPDDGRELKTKVVSTGESRVDGEVKMCYGKQCMEVTITRSAAREFDELPPTIQGRIIGIFERLKNYPGVSGVKPLRGNLAGRFRMRTGDYRVQFRLERNRVIVEKVGHRDRFYED